MNLIEAIWYSNHPLGLLLIPFGWLFCGLATLRKRAYQLGLLSVSHLPVPVIVVGNITVGGTGKTPLVIWLGQFLRQQGFKPGIVSRGYGGKATHYPQQVRPDSDPRIVGDESILLARHSGCPVAVAPKRLLAARSLLENYDCDLIISDDGLQHYALHRDIEIAVLDDIRRYGNHRCLPAGPLRESVQRLETIDFLVTKGAALQHEFSMQYQAKDLHNVLNENITQSLFALRGRTVHAVAGIGHPARFFNRLRDHGLKIIPHQFPDHYFYKPNDIEFNDNFPVVMTEKDAVKCHRFAGPQHWYLPIEPRLSSIFGERLLQHLKRTTQNGQKAT